MPKKVVYEVIINGVSTEATNEKEAETKLKNAEKFEFYPSYILIKEYSEKGKLLSEITRW